jgi:hypothetical protein
MLAIYVDLLGLHPISPFVLSKLVEELEKTVWAQIMNMLKLQSSYWREVTFVAI